MSFIPKLHLAFYNFFCSLASFLIMFCAFLTTLAMIINLFYIHGLERIFEKFNKAINEMLGTNYQDVLSELFYLLYQYLTFATILLVMLLFLGYFNLSEESKKEFSENKFILLRNFMYYWFAFTVAFYLFMKLGGMTFPLEVVNDALIYSKT